MKAKTIVLGEYAHNTVFRLYQFATPLTPPLTSPHNDANTVDFFCLDDLDNLFFTSSHYHASKNEMLARFYRDHPNYFCKDHEGRIYVIVKAISEIASKLQMFVLYELCRLTESDIQSGAVVSILRHVPQLRPCPSLGEEHEFAARPLEGHEGFLIKQEPSSPAIRLSPPKSSRMVESMQLPPPKPSSLLLKRLAPKHGKTPQLTIFTPSYAQNHHAAIHSAPLRPMVATQRVKPNKIVKRQPSSRLPPKTASAITAPYKITEFPSPPIVPSQQPATSTATSTSVHRPSSASNAAHAAAAAAAAAATAAAAASATAYRFNVAHSSVPKTPAPLTQKQQFLRPFEFLYDNIEHTQTLKATLDDQIRRSSTLIRSLQSSGTMIESLVRRQVREMVDQEFDDKLADCVERIHALEQRLQLRDAPLSPKHSPSPSPPGQPASDKQPMIREMFSELMNRLDQLENKMAPTVAS